MYRKYSTPLQLKSLFTWAIKKSHSNTYSTNQSEHFINHPQYASIALRRQVHTPTPLRFSSKNIVIEFEYAAFNPVLYVT